RARVALLAAGLVALAPALAAQQRHRPRQAAVPRRPPAPVVTRVPTPKAILGFDPGDDRKLADWPVLLRYYQALAQTSDRVRYRELGKTTLGAPLVALAISSPANLKSLDRYRQLNARLSEPRTIHTARPPRAPTRPSCTITTRDTTTTATGTPSPRSRHSWWSTRCTTYGIPRSCTTFISRTPTARDSSCPLISTRSSRTWIRCLWTG